MTPGRGPDVLEQAQAKACCADLYQSELARLILGETLHPGGLALTNRLARLMGVQPGDWVVDLASGRGASAMAVSRVFRCNVVGVEFGRAAASEAHAKAEAQPATPQGPSLDTVSTFGPQGVYFVQGDAERPPLRTGFFNALLSECSMSLFPDKSRAVAEAVGLLRPGGRFGLSDVTVAAGSLPKELDGAVGRILCLSDALGVDGYTRLLDEAGLREIQQVDASTEIIKLLDSLKAKLGAFTAWQGLTGGPSLDTDLLQRAPELIATLGSLVADGRLGYWLFAAEKPAAGPM
jgi:SAM-dependent methyltransferase